MKKLQHTGLVTAFVFACVFHAAAQSGYKFPNIVKIKTQVAGSLPEEGFGFVVYEENDSLYVVTAKHVVKPEKESEITMRFYKDSLNRKAELVNWHSTYDIALLKISLPVNYYAWEFRGNIKIPKPGDKIEIIGRYGSWMPLPGKMRGKIVQCNDSIFVADFYGAAVGSSGGPVISKNDIAGMIISDAGGQIQAIPIQTILQTVHQWLSVHPQKINDLPILSAGISLGGSSRAITPGRFDLMMDRSNELLCFKPGIFAEITMFEHFSLEADAAYRRVFKSTNPDFGPDIQYKNNYFTYSLSLDYHFFSNLGNPALISDVENPFFPKLRIGYSFNSTKPKINVENSGWEVLEDQLGVLPGYEKRFNSWFVGLGTNINLEYVNLQGEIMYENFSSKYLLLDVVDPLNSNIKNDWIISLSLKFGIILRPASSRVKLLR